MRHLSTRESLSRMMASLIAQSLRTAASTRTDRNWSALVEAAYATHPHDPSLATSREILDAAALLDAFGLHDEAERLHQLHRERTAAPAYRMAA